MFDLHPRLRQDTFEAAALDLCLVLLMNDRSFPWLMLVPQRDGVRELYDLSRQDRVLLVEETALAARVIRELYAPEKINIGALGNLVPQFHMHVIGRFEGDRAWPGPAWGAGRAVKYGILEANAECDRIAGALERAKKNPKP